MVSGWVKADSVFCTQPEYHESSVTRPGRGQFAPDDFNFVGCPFAERPVFNRLRMSRQFSGVGWVQIFPAPQCHMSRKILFARFRGKWLDRSLNPFLQINQQPFLIINSNPDDPGRMRVRKKSDAFGAQLQWPGAPANSVDRFLQLFQTGHGNIAQKPEREMKLIRLGPTNRATRRQKL